MFRDHYNIPLVHVDASELFLGALDGEADPETKRKTIGRLFIEMFEAEAKKIARRKRAGSSPRARSIPTSSRACPSPAARRSPSSRTTMSAACPSA